MTILDRNPAFASAYADQLAKIDAAVKREAPARYARKLAAQFFNERVSTIYDPRDQDGPWSAFFDDHYMARGRSEAQAIRHLIEHARSKR